MPEGRTHGCGKKSKSFSWRWDGQTLHIHREKNWLHDEFPLAELAEILKSLEDQFGSGWFPLANNVEKVSKKTEKRGFGMTIFRGLYLAGSGAGVKILTCTNFGTVS